MVLIFFCAAFSLRRTVLVRCNAAVPTALNAYVPPAESAAQPSACKRTGTSQNAAFWSALHAQNPDIIAWLRVPGTKIDQPVVQGNDNSYYLNHDASGTFSLSGSVFLDTAADAAFTDDYMLLYGHHMAGGEMLGQVAAFENSDFFSKHESGTIFLPGKTLPLHFFACVRADTAESAWFCSLPGGSRLQTVLLARIGREAVQYRKSAAQAAAGKPLLALSTCAQADSSKRILLIGWLEAAQ